MATLQQLENALIAADRAGAADDAKVLAGEIVRMRREQRAADQATKDREAHDPTKDMSGLGRVVAGYGSVIPTLVRGAGQMLGDTFDAVSAPARGFAEAITGEKRPLPSKWLGLPQQEDADEWRRINAPLADTGAGMSGMILGNIAAAIPTVAIPGAASARGSAVIGGLMGANQPVASDESRLANTGLGAGAGALGVATGRVVKSGYEGLKALIQPFSQSGRERLAGETLGRFAYEPTKVAAAQGRPTMTGAVPTLAEETGDAGIARLQDALRELDPQIGRHIDTRLTENNAARVAALRDLAGADGRLDYFVADRDAVAGKLYDAARKAGVDPAALTPAAQANMAAFAQRLPDAVLDEARQLAKINGEPMTDATSVQGLHWVKKALDSLIAREKGPKGSPEFLRAYAGLKNDLLAGMDQLSPAYAQARQTYAAMSRPINQMEVLDLLLKRGTSPTTDLAGNPRMLPSELLRAMRDEPRLISQAGGTERSLGDLLEPSQYEMLRAIASEANQAAAVERAAGGSNSATARRQSAHNVIRRTLGPLGLPESWVEGAFNKDIFGKLLGTLYSGAAEPALQRELAEAVLNPARAQQLLTAAGGVPQKGSDALEWLIANQAARTALPAVSVTRER